MTDSPSPIWYAVGGPAPSDSSAAVGSSRAAVHELVARIERTVAASPERAFRIGADGSATLHAEGATYSAGRFSTPSIEELEARVAARGNAGGNLRLSALVGTGPLSDIGALQATAPQGALFQVASQFNCLESPGPYVSRVCDYTSDPTQGPRASISAFPGTLLRHYLAPAGDGSTFVQSDGSCINLLDEVFDDSVAEVQSGYLQVANVHQPKALAAALEQRFHRVRVGLHDGVQVVFGCNWGGPVPEGEHRIAQVFTSTMALGGYGPDHGWEEIAVARRQLLRAAYLGTLLGAMALDQRTIVLTLIGGGVFGNPIRDIWNAIYWALDQAAPRANGTIDVIVNARDSLGGSDREQILHRGGRVIELTG